MRRQLRERLQSRVERELVPRVRTWTELKAAVADLDRACTDLRSGLARAEAVAEAIADAQATRRRRFTGDMTVHAAWEHHPGVERIFAALHLPACPDCAVGVDETLAEAAFGYSLNLDDLLAQLNRLLGNVPDSTRP